MSYKLCKSCGCPMLKKGQTRKHPDDYRHASGCPEELEPCTITSTHSCNNTRHVKPKRKANDED